MTRPLAFGVVVGLALGACSDGGVELRESTPTIFADPAPGDDPGPTPTIVTVTSTSTTVPVADRLPPLGRNVGGVVRSESGAALAVQGTDGVSWILASECATGVTLATAVDTTVVGPQHVVIDPGRGGADRGVVFGDGEEAQLNLDVAERVAAVLEVEGISVLLTRDDDVAVAPTTRAMVPGAVGAAVFVSLHHDVVSDADGGSGETAIEVFHRIDDPDSRRLGGLVDEELQAGLSDLDILGVASVEPGVKYLLNQRGSDFHTVLRESAGTPGVFVRLTRVSSAEGRQAEAEAIATAIVRFLVTDDEGRGFIEPTERVRSADSSNGVDGCAPPS